MGNCKGICCAADQTEQFHREVIITNEFEKKYSVNDKDIKIKTKQEKKLIEDKHEKNKATSPEKKKYIPISANKQEKSKDEEIMILSSSSNISDLNRESNATLIKGQTTNKVALDNELVAATIGNNNYVNLPAITLENNAVYTGNWANGMRNGKGSQIWPDNSKYDGEWLNDKAHGEGKLIHTDGDIYEGQWENDKANGFGTYFHSNGAKYVIIYF